MKKIIIILFLLITSLYLMTCARDQEDMHDALLTGAVPKVIYIFQAGMYTGDMQGRYGADLKCQIAKESTHNYLQVSTIKAFLSTSELDTIKYVVPPEFWETPVVATTNMQGTIISTTWLGLWDGSIDSPFSVSLFLSANWWSGSDSTGGYLAPSCGGWTDGTAGGSGTEGNFTSSTSTWVQDVSVPCNSSMFLLCVAY